MSWWRQDCPKRGVGLSHAHWSRCDPDGVHPHDDTGNEGNQHAANMCCHCQMTQEMEEKADIVMREQGMVSGGDTADHEYVWTIGGRCQRCQRVATVHPTYRRGANEGECVVDHTSITSRPLIDDSGLRWSTCPSCQMQVEPKLATGQPVGKPSGRGRGFLTDRHKEDLLKLVRREKFLAWLEAKEWLEAAQVWLDAQEAMYALAA